MTCHANGSHLVSRLSLTDRLGPTPAAVRDLFVKELNGHARDRIALRDHAGAGFLGGIRAGGMGPAYTETRSAKADQVLELVRIARRYSVRLHTWIVQNAEMAAIVSKKRSSLSLSGRRRRFLEQWPMLAALRIQCLPWQNHRCLGSRYGAGMVGATADDTTL